jgi:hypothetical protein
MGHQSTEIRGERKNKSINPKCSLTVILSRPFGSLHSLRAGTDGEDNRLTRSNLAGVLV